MATERTCSCKNWSSNDVIEKLLQHVLIVPSRLLTCSFTSPIRAVLQHKQSQTQVTHPGHASTQTVSHPRHPSGPCCNTVSHSHHPSGPCCNTVSHSHHPSRPCCNTNSLKLKSPIQVMLRHKQSHTHVTHLGHAATQSHTHITHPGRAATQTVPHSSHENEKKF